MITICTISTWTINMKDTCSVWMEMFCEASPEIYALKLIDLLNFLPSKFWNVKWFLMHKHPKLTFDLVNNKTKIIYVITYVVHAQKVIRPLTQLVPLSHFQVFCQTLVLLSLFYIYYLSDCFSLLTYKARLSFVYKHVSVLYPEAVPPTCRCGLHVCACNAFLGPSSYLSLQLSSDFNIQFSCSNLVVFACAEF